MKQFTDLSRRTISKILKRMKLGCCRCNWNKASLDLHHIVSKKDGGADRLDNLTAICPNCHREAHELKLTDLPSLQSSIGESWREFYYEVERSANPAVRKKISEGMKRAFDEGRTGGKDFRKKISEAMKKYHARKRMDRLSIGELQ